MNKYIKKLQNVVFYNGKKAPMEIEKYDFVRDNTADSCDEEEFMDYYSGKYYPVIRLCLERDEDNNWKVREGVIGIFEDGNTVSNSEILSAYVLQELGIIKNKVKKVDFDTEEYDMDDIDYLVRGYISDNDRGLIWNT